MSQTTQFVLMAQYNQWINHKIYTALAPLDHAILTQDNGAFFGSILATLNHILVGDILWMQRFAKHPNAPTALHYVASLEKPTALNSLIHPTLAALTPARQSMDKCFTDFTAQLDETLIQTSLSYTNTQGISATKNFGLLIHNLFNHQTHHRGQVTTLLSQQGIDIGVTDFLTQVPEQEQHGG